MLVRLSLVLVIILPIITCEMRCPDIITKRLWGGKPQLETEYLIFPAKYVIITHTVSSECYSEEACVDIVTNIQNSHMDDNKWHDIGFSFLVGGDGNVYEGTGWHRLGAHTYGYNRNGVGIALIGNFEKKLPSPAQLETTKRLIECGFSNKELAKNYKLMAQRQLISTVSPGLKVFQEIQSWPHWSRDPFPKSR